MARNAGLKPRDARDRMPVQEKVLMAVSAVVTVALFGYVAWQAVVSPGLEPPVVTITGVATDPSAGGVRVAVEVENPGGVGFEAVDVEVACGNTTAPLQFSMVPAGGVRSGTVVCPAGTENPQARVTSWVPA